MVKKIVSVSVVIFLLSVIMLKLTGCSSEHGSPEQAVDNLDRYSIREGKRLYLNYCSPCHGNDGDGEGRYFPSQMKPRPKDFVNSDYLEKTSNKVIFKAIKFGSQSLGKSSYSPPYGKTLRDEEIENTIQYLKYMKTKNEKKGTYK